MMYPGARRRRTTLALFLVLPILTSLAGAADPQQPPGAEEARFMRYVDLDDLGGRLEAEVATYRNADGVTVDLVSAVHVADKAYFDALSQRFATYDAVLYEMVKPKGAAVPGPGAARSDSPISMIQRVIKDMLALDFQLDAIDYSAANFVHADLDAETFARLQEERGESLMGMMLQSMLEQTLKGQPQGGNEPTLEELLRALGSPDRPRQLKLLLAPQFSKMEDIMAGFEGPNGSVLVTERNKAAVAKMLEQIAAGNDHLAIFFGAAHMPGIEKMIEELGFKKTDSNWIVAWDMTGAKGKQDQKEEIVPDNGPEQIQPEEADPTRAPQSVI